MLLFASKNTQQCRLFFRDNEYVMGGAMVSYFVCRLLPAGGGFSGKLSHCHRSSSFCFVQVVARGGWLLWEALSLP